jgi:hypothetical protein
MNVPEFIEEERPDSKSSIAGVAIGNETQLFVDDWMVERMTDLKRTLHQPVKKGLIREADGKPWLWGVGPSVVRDSTGRFHMVYRAGWSDPGVRDLHPSIGSDKAQWIRRTYAYAQSEDGIRWKKPVLGLVDGPTSLRRAPKEKWKDGIFSEPIGFSKENNLGCPIAVIQDVGGFGGVSDPKRRYLVNVLYRSDTHNFAPITDAGLYFAADVPDILNDPDWRSRMETVWEGPERGPRSETTHVAGFDEQRNRWFVCTQSRIRDWGMRGGRDISRYASKDLIHWSPDELVLPIADDESRKPDNWIEYMELSAFRAGGLWLGQLVIFHGDRTSRQYLMPGRENVWRKGTTELRLVASRDAGKSWDRVCGKQVWLPHSEEKYGTDRMLYPGCPVRVGDELWIYYSAYDGDHLVWNGDGTLHDKKRPGRVGRIALATLRWDGYVSLDAGESVEELVTKPLQFFGDKLIVNLHAPQGMLLVELLDASGKPIGGFTASDCRPISGDGVSLPVSWEGGGGLEKLEDRTIRVRFSLTKAALYSFRFVKGGH